MDGATIEIEPITKSGTIDGGNWSISPAGVQTVTTGGHTNDDNYQNNGGAASASWSVHYTVTKTVDGRSGSVGPYTTKEAADAAANSERDSAVAAIQAEAQSAVNNAIASAQAQLASLQFRYDEVTIPYGFESYWGSNGSHQTITVPANSNNAYEMGKRINRSFKDCHMPAARTLRGITKVISFVAAIDILFEIAADTAHTGKLRFPGIIFPNKHTNRFSMIPGFVKNPGL